LSESADLEEAAKNLFSYMRDLDNDKFKGMAVMSVPNEGVGMAINDRLLRASKGSKP
ncbi:MAG: translation factor Sua5, partial [Alphaproteobacteria bacterium]|nr:translation factor Sua5 [Alphaproteobacteria bacterium]